MKSSKSVQVGDKFTKAERRGPVYVVVTVRTKPGHPPHALLASEAGGEAILIGVPALTDASLYKRVA